MKKSDMIQIPFTAMDAEELTGILGGGFAYDCGRTLRYMGIYIYEGGGIRGLVYASGDFIANMVVNSTFK